MPRRQDDEGAVLAMGQGDARISRNARSGSNARNHFEADAFPGQGDRLFSPPSEDKGIPPFQPGDRFALSRLLHHQPIDIGLRDRLLASPLAGIYDLGLLPGQFEEPLVGEIIVDDDVRLLNAFPAADREQAGVPRPGSNQINFAVFLATHALHPPYRRLRQPPNMPPG